MEWYHCAVTAASCLYPDAGAGVPSVSRLRDIFPTPLVRRLPRVVQSWRSSVGILLAQGIYADRAFDRLPILADALEEAGCTDAVMLAHCRGPGPHVRGCWAVDLILGKE
jgi:hypothetical protein